MVRNSNFGNSDEESLFALNEMVADRYRVIALLGKGGMGAVYEVEQIYLGKVFALKAILKSATTETNIRRFQSEAKVYFALNHPNIISVYDFGLLNDDTPFLVMELLRGETLATRIKRGAMSAEEILPIFSQICSGLRHAHEHNVIHRDIKPSNIMLLNTVSGDTNCSIKILDFGIAKLVQDDSENLQALTRTGEIFGSPIYMSPEQCSGGKIDKRSDIYSLGCVLFEALTGTPPFVGDNMLTTMVMHQSAPVPTLKEASLGEEFPQHLERMVARMLEKNPAQRYQDTAEIERHLTLMRDGSDTNTLQLTDELQKPKSETSAVSPISVRRSSFYLLSFSTILFFAFFGFLTAHIHLLNSIKPIKKAAVDVEPSSQSLYSPAEDQNYFKRRIQRHSSKIDPSGRATDADLKIFAGYKNAQSVCFVDTKVTENGLLNFKDSKLLDLDVTNGDIKSIDAIIEQQPYLQSVNIAGTQIQDADLKKVAQLKMLKDVDIRNCSLSEKGVRQLLSSKSLRQIQLTQKKFIDTFIEEIRLRMPQCGIGEEEFKSKEQELKDNLGNIPEQKRFDQLYQLVARGPSDSTELATLLREDATRCFLANDIRRTKEKLQAAENILTRNGDKAALCELFLAKATLAKVEHRWLDFDKVVGALSKDYFVCYRHDKDVTWDNLKQLTTDVHGPGKFTNTIQLCEQAMTILKEEFEPTKDLQFFAERAAWLSWECADLKRGIKAAEENFELCQTSGDPLKRAKSGIILAHYLPVGERRKQLYLGGMKQIEDLHFPVDENLREHYCDAAASMVFICAQEKNADQAVFFARQGLEGAKKITIDNRKRENLFAQLLIKQLKQANKKSEAEELEERYRAHG